jgi:hypothetical protein
MNISTNTLFHHAHQSGSKSTICPQGLSNLIHLLRRRAQEHGEKTIYTYLNDGESDETRLTYGELERKAHAIAAYLQSHISPGERVLLLYPPGIDFPRPSSAASAPAWSPCRPTPRTPTSSWQASSRRYPTRDPPSPSPPLPPWKSTGGRLTGHPAWRRSNG